MIRSHFGQPKRVRPAVRSNVEFTCRDKISLTRVFRSHLRCPLSASSYTRCIAQFHARTNFNDDHLGHSLFVICSGRVRFERPVLVEGNPGGKHADAIKGLCNQQAMHAVGGFPIHFLARWACCCEVNRRALLIKGTK